MKVREPVVPQFLSGGGEMGALMRAKDWSATPLGPVERWPQSLRTIVGTMLASRIPMVLFWGADYIQLYNDGYIGIYGPAKHPQALGESGKHSWREVWDFVGARFDEIMASGTTTSNEDQLFLIDRHGFIEESYFTFSYSPVRDESGEVGGVLSTCVETTHRVIGERRLETLSALAALPSRFDEASAVVQGAVQLLEQNAGDFSFAALYLRDPGDEHFWLVPASRHLAEAGLLPLEAVIGAEDVTPALPFGEAVAGGRLVVREAPNLAITDVPVGCWRLPVRAVAIAPIAIPGQSICAGFLVAGLSPRLALDDAYRDFIATAAANIVAALNHAYAYEQESRRARLLEELNHVKTEFFSNVSHEFRTPITLLLGPAETLLTERSQALPAAARCQIEHIYRNALRLSKMINAMLDFSRIEAGRAQGVFQPTDLAAVTADLVSMFRAAIERAGLVLAIDCAPLREPVYVDREMWEKIVLNLVSNALKFTFGGTIRVSLAVRDGEAVLAVSDTGVGIPAHELAHVFERFHRVRDARSRTHEGTGIGLALVAELARLHGGRAWLDSVVDEGTTVHVAVPLGRAHLDTAQIREADVTIGVSHGQAFVEEALRWLPETATDGDRGLAEDLPATQSPRGVSRGRVLIADDNADLRQYLCQLLSGRYDVEAVADGSSALSAATLNPPDLVLADVMMPGLDGLALLRALKSDPRTFSTPVILLSARAGEEARIEGVAAGADDYLVKPFSARELLARIDARLEVWRLRRASEQREDELLAQIREGKTWVEAILASINDAFAVLDGDWRYTYVNDAAQRMSDRTAAQLLGNVIWDCFPDLRGTRFESEVRAAAARRAPARFEYCHERSERWFDVRVNVVAEGVSVIGTEITHSKRLEQDLRQVRNTLEARVAERTADLANSNQALAAEVAERRRAERELRDSEERLRSAFAGAAVGMAMLDSNARVITANQAYAELTGYAPEVLQTLDLVRLTHPVDRLQTIRRIRGLLAGDFESFVLEKRYLHGGHGVVWAQDSVAVVGNPASGAKSLIVLSENITERKRAQQALRESEARFRSLTELSSDWYWEQDAEFRFTHMSAGFIKATGADPGFLIGRRRWDLDTAGMTDAQWAAHRAALEARRPFYDLQFGVRLSGADFRWISTSGEPVYDGEGVFAGYRGVAVDITARRREQFRARALAELSLLALRERGLKAVCQRAVELVREDLDVALVNLLKLLPDGCAFLLESGVGWKPGLVGRITVAAGLESQAGYALYAEELHVAGRGSERAPVIVDDLASENRFRGSQLLLEHGVVSSISVVIFDEDRPYGVLGAHSATKRHFDAGDADFMRAVANVVSAAIVRHRAQSRIAESETRLQVFMQNSPSLMFIKDLTGRYLLVNDRFLRDFGLTREQLLGRRDDELFPAEQAAEFMANDARALESGAAIVVEEQANYGDEPHTSLVSKFPLFGADGRSVALGGIATDITERLAAEQAVRHNERVMRNMLEHLPSGVWLTDAKGRIVMSNPAGRRIWGGARYVGIDDYGEYKGWWSGTDRRIQPHEWALARAIERGETSIDELIDIEGFDGVRRTILNSAVPLRDESGSITGAIVVNEDVTARRKVETAVASMAAGLASNTGRDFFSLLVESMAQVLNVDGAFIVEVDSRLQGRTAAAYAHGSRVDDFNYDLRQSPCERVVLEARELATDKPRAQFVRTPVLDRFGMQEYAGTPLVDSEGQVLGLMFVASSKPFENPEFVSSTLHIMASRAAAELERMRNELTVRTLVRASEVLHSAADIPELERAMAALAAEVAGARRARAALLGGDGRFRSAGEIHDGVWQPAPREWQASEVLAQPGAGVILSAAGEHFGAGTFVLLPLDAGNRSLLGFVELHDTPANVELPRVMRERLLGIGRIAAIAVERVLSTDRVLRAEQGLRESEVRLRALAARLQGMLEDERTRIAREIHDVLGQALTGLKLDVAWLKRELPAEQTAAIDQLQAIGASLDGIVRTVRRISSDLRPGELDDLGLVAAIETLVEEFQGRSGIRCRAQLPESDLDIDIGAATALFRICQELLTNVARHARATRVDLFLTSDASECVLNVRDNGRGMRAGQATSRTALGLIGIRERARMFGGSAWFESAPGEGTTVTVRLPLQPAARGTEQNDHEGERNGAADSGGR